MPMIEVTAPAGAIPAEAREELLSELAGRLLHWEGAPSQRRRAGLVADVHEAVAGAMGVTPEEAGIRVWVLCREIAEGSWGAAGAIVEFSKLREAAQAERE